MYAAFRRHLNYKFIKNPINGSTVPRKNTFFTINSPLG